MESLALDFEVGREPVDAVEIEISAARVFTGRQAEGEIAEG